MTTNLLGMPPTLLPEETDVLAALADDDTSAAGVVTAHPSSPLAWSILSDEAFADGRIVESYAFARVGYHRGLDALRKAGWKGQGPIPWSHEPNRGVLRCLFALRRAAETIGEDREVARLGDFLTDADPTAVEHISAEA